MADREDVRALLLALLAGIVVYLIAIRVFPHHSTNHDEAVYLQQAAMLLEGQLRLRPPVPDAFRPWFFVRDGATFYSKYAPLPAAIFAIGLALGDPNLSLAAVGAVLIGGTYLVVTEVFDARVALAAAAFVLASPLFLVDTAVFLPYAPTLALELAFAGAYLRADRTGSLRLAAVAGAAIGLAFFSRPYTAVVFAFPFVCHALWRLRPAIRALQSEGWRVVNDDASVRRQAVTAGLGLAGVAVTLAYNTTVTGSPTTFPYEAFAPRDGLGFGRRAILGYERVYTPELAIRSNAIALERYATEWVAAGPIGTLLAVLGGTAVLIETAWDRVDELDRSHSAILLGVAVTVIVGNLYFWGTLNTLGALDDPRDGLIRTLGPYYHFDLLLPTAAFAGYALVRGVDRGRAVLRTRFAGRGTTRRVLLVTLFLVSAALLGGSAVAAIDRPLTDNRAVTDRLDAAYAPFESEPVQHPPTNGDPDSEPASVVFLPTPYGDWLNHPFQKLRNDPQYDGDVVYALDERPFAVVDAFPDRRLYRYAYDGEWAPVDGSPVTARLQRVRHAAGDAVALNTSVGVPSEAERVSIRVATEGESAYYTVTNRSADEPAGTLRIRLRLDSDGVRVEGPVDSVGDTPTVRLPRRGTVDLVVFVNRGRYGFSYRLEVPVARESPRGPASIRALTPRIEVCDVPRRCDGEAAYIPRTADPGVSVRTSLRASG